MLSDIAQAWVTHLEMLPHPEGGFYRETYRSPLAVSTTRIGEERALLTHIYFLLKATQFSAFHRIRSDELWHWYDGGPIEVLEIRPSGELITHRLGKDLTKGQLPFCVVAAESWFGSRPLENTEFALVGCSVAPGFDFKDFELADCESLCRQFPSHSSIIRQLTR